MSSRDLLRCGKHIRRGDCVLDGEVNTDLFAKTFEPLFTKLVELALTNIAGALRNAS